MGLESRLGSVLGWVLNKQNLRWGFLCMEGGRERGKEVGREVGSAGVWSLPDPRGSSGGE